MNHSLPDKYRAVNLSDIVDIRPDVDASTSYPQETVSKAFRKVSAERGDLTALVSCKGVTYSWKQYYENSHQFARALVASGLKCFDPVTVLGFNSPEYMFTALGCIEAGGIITGIYATNGPEACFYVMNHCNSSVIVVDGKAQFNKILEIRNRLPCLRMIVIYNYDGFSLPKDEEGVARVRSWHDFLAMGSPEMDDEIDKRVANQKPGQCLSLIYTSGTTGNPKAVMISHDNVVFVVHAIQDDFGFTTEDRIVSFLPLSHIAAQMIDIFAAMLIGFKVFYARPDALKGSLVNTLCEAHPTIFVTVPRVFEKMMEKIVNTMEQARGVKRWILDFCRKRGTMYSNNIQVGTKKQKVWFYNLAKKLLLDKIRMKLGLDSARYLFSAAAPIEMKTLQFFASFGIPVFEIFGMSESTGPSSFHTGGHWKMGTVGKAMKGTIMKTVPGTNEIILSGRHVFMGYLKMPEETLRAIDDEGYLHSGDCGEVDLDGFWKITGRIKELIVTAGGENIPPVLIESQLKSLAPCISNAVLIGDKRKFLSVLITLQCRVAGDSEGKEGELIGESLKIAKEIGSSATTVQEAIEDPLFITYIQDVINQYNSKAFSNAQKYEFVEYIIH